MKILVVEDRPENIEEAKKYFAERQDIVVDYAKDYKEAIERLDSKDGLICDLFFPEETGTGKKGKGKELYIKIGEEILRSEHGFAIRDLDDLYDDVWKNPDEAKQPLGVLVIEEARSRNIPYTVTSSMHAAHGSSATPVAVYLVRSGLLKDENSVIESGNYGFNRHATGEPREAELTNPRYVKGRDVWETAANSLLEKI
ncbi:MAG TPA: response regulator [archaeon]|nr:response regulator [archaeon]